MENFDELNLPDFLRKSIHRMNFVKPMPVQAQAIPLALEGRDVIASAQTGMGKTVAFGVPLLTFLSKNPGQTALVLTPTRELAMQVLEVLRKLSGDSPLGGSVLIIGGASMGNQLQSLSRKPRLVIGTPGRIIDHLARLSLSLERAGFLVLDEADRMLDMGFAPQLERILKHLPAKRQTLLFSATIPPDIQVLGARFLRDPVRVAVGPTTQPIPQVSQVLIHTNEVRKFEELTAELEERQGSVLLFCRTQHRVDRILDKLKKLGVKATRIHGGRSQSQRRQAIEQFREGKIRVLVATDIAARGLDIHHIAHVINYDLPRNPEDYIHRVGRTARAGALGSALCLLTGEDRGLWERILKLMGLPKEAITVKASRFGIPLPPAHPPAQHQRAFPEHSRRNPPADNRHPNRPERSFDRHDSRRSHPARAQERAATGPIRRGSFDRSQSPPGHKPDGFSPHHRRPDERNPHRRSFSETSHHTRPGEDHRRHQGQTVPGQDRPRPFDRSQSSPGFKPHAPNKRHWHPNGLNPRRGENRFEKNNFIYHGPAGGRPSQDRQARFNRRPGEFQKPPWKKGPKPSHGSRWHNPQR
jgi:ATP-dependent RNA helicase DeaD